jgi:dihydroorotase
LYDLILRGGHVIDPANGADLVEDIAFVAGRVAAVSTRIDGPARVTRDVAGCIVAPGLIDLHTHVYWGGTSISIRPEIAARDSGVTTLVDAGSAGAGNFDGFRAHVIERSPIRILAFLNISFPGIYAYSANVMVGETGDLRLLNIGDCVRVIEEHRELIAGIKVRIGLMTSETNGIAPLDIAIEAAEATGLPVMAHIDNPPPSRREILSRLRPGDILTHCFKPYPNSLLDSHSAVWDDVLEARERGVIFDIGHGRASFGFAVARGMLANGFMPDVISSDIHALNADGSTSGLLSVMSKFYSLGCDLPSVVRAATAKPAEALRRGILGHLGVGALGDATILASENGDFTFRDAVGETLRGERRLVLRGVVAGGQWQEI